jgi:hypothetical protein
MASVLVVGMTVFGCAQAGTVLDTKTKQGAVLGALGGALAGAAIGGKDHRAGGALIGAATGALAGGLLGRYLDNQARELDAIPGANVQRRDDSLLVNFESAVLFDTNKSQLQPGAYDKMRSLATTLNNYPQSSVMASASRCRWRPTAPRPVASRTGASRSRSGPTARSWRAARRADRPASADSSLVVRFESQQELERG